MTVLPLPQSSKPAVPETNPILHAHSNLLWCTFHRKVFFSRMSFELTFSEADGPRVGVQLGRTGPVPPVAPGSPVPSPPGHPNCYIRGLNPHPVWNYQNFLIHISILFWKEDLYNLVSITKKKYSQETKSLHNCLHDKTHFYISLKIGMGKKIVWISLLNPILPHSYESDIGIRNYY
jgi:hypothetical protein